MKSLVSPVNPDNPKTKRSDVSERLSSNKNIDYVTVKSTLNSFFNKKFTEDSTGEFYQLLNKPLNNILIDLNKVMVEAHILANLHTLRMLKLNFNVLVNQDYFYKCISAVSKSDKKKKDITDIEFAKSVELYRNQRPQDYVEANSSYISAGIFNCLSKQMATEASNFIEMRFYKIFMRFIKNKYDLDGHQAYKIIENIRALDYDCKNHASSNIIVIKYRDLIQKLIKKIPADIVKELSDENFIKIQEKMKLAHAKKLKIEEEREKKFLNSKKGKKETSDEKILRLKEREEREKEHKLETDKINQTKEKLQNSLKRYKDLEHPYVALPILYKCLEYFESNNIKYEDIDISKTTLKKNKKKCRNRNRNRKRNKELIDKYLKSTESLEIIDKPLKSTPLKSTKIKKIKKKKKKKFKEYRDSKNNSVFSILPMKQGFTISHIKICNTGLYGLIKRAEIAEPVKMAKFLNSKNLTLPTANDWDPNEAYKYWSAFFNISKFETVNRKFSGEIQTDGKAVSICIKRQKIKITDTETDTETDKTNEFIKKYYGHIKECDLLNYIESNYKTIQEFLKDKYKGKEIWGFDPGSTDIYVGTNTKNERISVTTRSFYEKSKYRESNRIIKGWQDRDSRINFINKNMPSPKTSKIEQVCIYIKFLLQNLDYLLNFHMTKGFRTLKLKRYIYSKKELKTMCKPFNNSMVGFGNWSNSDSIIKSSQKGPVKKFELELRKHCKVVSIDEFRTSKLHNKCFSELTNQYSLKKMKDGSCCNHKVHSVLHCKKNGCLGITMNRDDNASKNILDIFLYYLMFGPKQRHPAFDRSRNLEENFTQSASVTLFIKLNKS